jgi:hypothetical protein
MIEADILPAAARTLMDDIFWDRSPDSIREQVRERLLAIADEATARTLRAVEQAVARLPTPVDTDGSEMVGSVDRAAVLAAISGLRIASLPTSTEGLDDKIDAIAEALDAVDRTLDGLPDTAASGETIDALAVVANAWTDFIQARLAALSPSPTEESR